MKIEFRDNTVWLTVKVVPNSSRTEVVGRLGDALKIKVAQPPEGGKANRGVEQLLASILNVPPSNISVAVGRSRALKVVRIRGIAVEAVESMLRRHLQEK